MQERIIVCIITCVALVIACRKPYQPPAITTNYGFLVVEGVINTGTNAITSITLSRSRTITDAATVITPELQAQVSIISDAGTTYSLTGAPGGLYQSAALSLDITHKYRLRIITRTGVTYQSDLVTPKQSPPIDSITWKQDKAVTLYVHSHDPQNKTTYYRWEYDETFQYRSLYEALLGVKNGIIFYRDASTQVYNCWITNHSTNVLTASSLALGSDVISYAPLTVIPDSTDKLGVRYSINVFQYALSEEAYRYWDVIKKSTQQTGTIFDLQPSQLPGNIHNIQLADEPVLGYISAGSVAQKRVFIDNKDLNNYVYISQYYKDICDQKQGLQDAGNYLRFIYPDTTYSPYYFITPSTIAVLKTPCLDCSRLGGSPVKPAFWQ